MLFEVGLANENRAAEGVVRECSVESHVLDGGLPHPKPLCGFLLPEPHPVDVLLDDGDVEISLVTHSSMSIPLSLQYSYATRDSAMMAMRDKTVSVIPCSSLRCIRSGVA